MKALLYVAFGGSFGAVCRWSLGTWIDHLRGKSTDFPLGIFTVNMLGCFFFGLLFGLGENRSWMTEHLRLFLFTSFFGSFTTFSTFSWNTMTLVKSGQIGLAIANIGLSVGIGLAGVWGGYSLATYSLTKV